VADTYTSSLRIAQQTIGGNENSWGGILNDSLRMLDQAVAGIVSISVTAGNVTLSTANNTDDDARNALIIFTGTPGATRTVTMPNVEKLTWVVNNSDSTVTLTAGAAATVAVKSGAIDCVYCDGINGVASLLYPQQLSWTPTLIGGITPGTQTYVNQYGRYIVRGRHIWITGYVEISAKDPAMTGDVTIAGLPFTLSNAQDEALTLMQFNVITFADQLTLKGIKNTSTLKLIQQPSGGSPSFIQASAIGSTCYIGFTGWVLRA